MNLLAVLEHLTGSPKLLLSKIFKLLKDDGDFVFVVPNQARLAKRISLLFGYSVMPPYEDYFDSEYPFEGHHREYVFSEVNYMMNKSNFYVTKLYSVSYGLTGNLVKKIFFVISYFLPKTFGQIIFAVAKKINKQKQNISN